MADIWLGLACQRQQVPMITSKRDKGWLVPLQSSDNVYDRYKNSDSKQTQVVNNVKQWRLYELAEENDQLIKYNPEQRWVIGAGVQGGF